MYGSYDMHMRDASWPISIGRPSGLSSPVLHICRMLSFRPKLLQIVSLQMKSLSNAPNQNMF